jgi:hypothetical protein
VDQKGYKCIKKLINTNKIVEKLLSGPFHVEINIMKGLMKEYYDYPIKDIAHFYGINCDFSLVQDKNICLVRKIVSISTFVTLKILLDYVKICLKMKVISSSLFFDFFEKLKIKNKTIVDEGS